MNDPGLDDPIASDAQEVEKHQDDSVDGEAPDGVDDEEAYLEPSRWWFASTAIPLIAGTFGPMASAFNICALASQWRVNVGPDETQDSGQPVPDPAWLIGINAVSLALALIANLALLFNMARRLSFTIAQPITIIGWFLSSFILIGLVIAAHVAPSFQIPGQRIAMSQAFYYAIEAAVLYFIIAALMCVTVFGAYRGHYPKAFKLTISQRTLMVQTISYLVYVIAGGAVFAHVEGWLLLDGVYWANTTLLTIGTGDYYPATHTGQSLLFPYAIGGIVHLGLVVGSIRSLVLERGKKKLAVRMVEKKREQIIEQMKNNGGTVRVNLLTHKRHLALGDQPELERRKAEFEVMRMIQEHASTKRKWYSLITSLLAWFVLWFIGALVFWLAERGMQGLTYFEALFFAYVSLLTIGYGDIAPVADSSKAFFVFWSLLAVPTLTILISNMGDTVIKMVKDVTMYVYELTLLPGEESTRSKLKRVAQMPPTQLFSGSEKPHEEPAGGASMPEQDRDLERGSKKPSKGMDRAIDRLGRDYEEEEIQEIQDAHRRGDRLAEDRHLYHYELVKEIRRVMRNANNEPAHKYNYSEWAWFLRLLGENESDRSLHREPPTDPNEDLSKGQSLSAGDENPDTGERNLTWSWVGSRSPLMGECDESEWLLERLTTKLTQMLQEEHRNNSPRHPHADEKGSKKQGDDRKGDEKKP